jgi:hypothetical protein
MMSKIDADRGVVDVAKNRVVAAPRDEPIEDAPRNDARVVAAVRDRYVGYRCFRRTAKRRSIVFKLD